MSDLKNYLEAIVKIRGNKRNGNAYTCREDLVLQEGRPMPWRRKPRGISYGREKHCFMNALHLSAATGWSYCEGFAIGTGGIALAHAWVIDPDGFVVDNTWRYKRGVTPEYFGVAMSEDFVFEYIIEKGTYGVFGEHPMRDPILAKKFEGGIN